MPTTITIDNLTIDESIPGLKIGTLSSGGVSGTFSIIDQPISNNEEVKVYELKGNDLYFSADWMADYETSTVNHFPSVGYWHSWFSKPKISFKDQSTGEVTTQTFTLVLNDLDESIDLTAENIYKNVAGATFAKIGGYDSKFSETTLGYTNTHDFFEISGDYLKLKTQYYFDGIDIIDLAQGLTHKISSIPDLNVNVKGGISHIMNEETYGDTVFTASDLETKFFNSENTKYVDQSIIKIIPQVFATNTYGETIAVISVSDANISIEQIVFKKSNSVLEVARTVHTDAADVDDAYTYELRLKEKFYFDGTQIKDFQGNSFALSEIQDLFNYSDFTEKFFSSENYVESNEIDNFNHTPVVVSNISAVPLNSDAFEYKFETFDIDSQSDRFPTEPSKVLVSGNSIASSPELLEKVEAIAAQKSTPAFMALIGDKNGVIEFGMSGIRSIETDIPIFLADRFYLASNGKSMTGYIVAKFVEEGKLSWESKIPELFPNIQNIHSGFANVTMKDLNDHTSGIATVENVPGYSWTSFDSNIAKHRADFAEAVFTKIPTNTDYRYDYSNLNQTFAASALENISGKSWEVLMQEYIYTPFGMLDAGFGPATVAGVDHPVAYELDMSSEVGQQVVDFQVLPDGITTLKDSDMVAKEAINMQLIAPSGNATMSIWDWAKYATAILNKGNLGAETMSVDAWKGYITPETGSNYSGGWGAYNFDADGVPTLLEHGGSNFWVSSSKVDFNNDYYIIGMSNEGWVQAHTDLVDYLQENYTQKSAADYVFEAAKAIKSDMTVYSAIDVPDWLSFDTTTGILAGTPGEANIGNHTVSLVATDSAGASTKETIFLKVGNDKKIEITESYERFEGTSKDDRLWGSNNKDVLIGLAGDDILSAEAGNDQVMAGDGSDIITGGKGNDTLTGGLGNDKFIYSKGDGNDTIVDFESLTEIIEYIGYTDQEKTQFSQTVSNNGDTLVTLTDGAVITLKSTEIPDSTFTLNGTIFNREGAVLSDVSVAADLSSSTGQVVAKSSITGSFSFTLENGVSANISADMIHVNTPPSEALTEQDVLEVLRLSAGLKTSAGSQTGLDYLTADFNKNGMVTPQDALDLLKYTMGIGDFKSDWVFINKAEDYSNIKESNVTYTEGVSVTAMSADLDIAMTGILLGDISKTYLGSLVDVAPNSLTLSSNTVLENSPGEIVGTLNAIDPNGDAITYSLASGGDNDFFEIDGTTLKLKTGVAANYEVDNSYSVTLNASDGYFNSSLNTLVNVTNVNEANTAFYNGKVDGGAFETPYSGNDPAVEHLISSKFWGTAGQGIDLTYSFMSSDSSFYEHGDGPHYPYYYGITDIQTPSEALQAQVARVLSDISSVTLLNFSQVPTTGDVVGHIRIGVSPTGGAPFATNAGSGPTAGDLWLTHTSYNDPALVIDGTSNSDTIAHEIGHTLGLNHPEGQMGTNVGQVHASKPYSVMAYPDYVGEVIDGKEVRWSNSTTLMIDDIAALQYLYGVNEQYKTGDDVYTLGSFDDGTTYNDYINASIWDAGGTDTISWAGQTTVASINLGAGSFCFFGNITGTDSEELDDTAFEPGSGLLGVGYNVVIENAIGGSNIDAIVGNSVANTLYGGAGSGVKDTLTGNAGADIFVCSLSDAVTDATFADVITDFVNGTDLIGLEDRTYSDLTILDSGLDTRIIDTNSSKILFVLQSFDHTLIDIADFVVTDFV
ncbi:MAG: serine hydrolase [Planktomarina sp.]|nr:serine hydrolase [Planktomarina sp.]